MPPDTTFGAPLIGQTENALRAILDRELAGTGLTAPQWMVLTLTTAAGGPIARDRLAGRLASALKLSESQAQTHITALAAGRLLHAPDDRGTVSVTGAGRELQRAIRCRIADIGQLLWGDLQTEDLATAARVLGTVLARANQELSQV